MKKSIGYKSDTSDLVMKKGRVKFFNVSKGYGFIHDNATELDIFVHASGLRDPIREGDDVIYEVERGKRGLSAVRVIRSPKLN